MWSLIQSLKKKVSSVPDCVVCKEIKLIWKVICQQISTVIQLLLNPLYAYKYAGLFEGTQRVQILLMLATKAI